MSFSLDRITPFAFSLFSKAIFEGLCPVVWGNALIDATSMVWPSCNYGEKKVLDLRTGTIKNNDNIVESSRNPKSASRLQSSPRGPRFTNTLDICYELGIRNRLASGGCACSCSRCRRMVIRGIEGIL